MGLIGKEYLGKFLRNTVTLQLCRDSIQDGWFSPTTSLRLRTSESLTQSTQEYLINGKLTPKQEVLHE